jgi:hypothetical protein
MWFFKRKAVNRRIDRPRGLEVRVRTEVARAHAARRAGAVFFSILGTLLALFIFWRGGEWVLQNIFFDDQSYALRRVEIQTDGRLPVELVQRWSGVRLGQNLIVLNLGRIKQELEANPTIRSATLERVLPGTLRIRITERVPIAEVQVSQPRADGTLQFTRYRLDAEGVIMPPLDPRPPERGATDGNFPLITGVSPEDILGVRQVKTPATLAALRLIAAYEQSPMVGLDDLQRVEVQSSDTLQATTYLGALVTFSAENLDRQLARWRAIFDYGRTRQRRLAWLDLAVTNNVPARWQEPGTLLAPPREPRHIQPRRRHV